MQQYFKSRITEYLGDVSSYTISQNLVNHPCLFVTWPALCPRSAHHYSLRVGFLAKSPVAWPVLIAADLRSPRHLVASEALQDLSSSSTFYCGYRVTPLARSDSIPWSRDENGKHGSSERRNRKDHRITVGSEARPQSSQNHRNRLNTWTSGTALVDRWLTPRIQPSEAAASSTRYRVAPCVMRGVLQPVTRRSRPAHKSDLCTRMYRTHSRAQCVVLNGSTRTRRHTGSQAGRQADRCPRDGQRGEQQIAGWSI